MYPEPSGEEQGATAFVERQLEGTGLLTRRGPEGGGLIVDSPAGDRRQDPRARSGHRRQSGEKRLAQ
jgi:hypothetical protein